MTKDKTNSSFELQSNNRDWFFVRTARSNLKEFELKEATRNQNVHIRNESDINKITVNNKVNRVILEKCDKVNIIIGSVQSAIEVINCKNCQIQILGAANSILIDNSEFIHLYASFESRFIEITTCLVSNVVAHYQPYEDKPDEWIEMPIPTQFVHCMMPSLNKLDTKVSNLFY